MIDFSIFSEKKILLIDDSSVSLKYFANLIEQYNCQTILTQDPHKAIVAAESHRPDCILCDYEMPNLSGKELCVKFKENPALRNIPFMMLTSRETDEDFIDCIGAGADDYLFKNANPDKVLIKLQAMLRMKTMQDELTKYKELAAVESLIVTLNHEFNNVITIVNGASNILKNRYLNSSENFTSEVDILDRLLRTNQRLVDLIKKIKAIDQVISKEYSQNVEMLSLDMDKKK
jgi:two-component system, sensor histidine kinase and response regulator